MYRSKRVGLIVEACNSGFVTCDKEGNIYKNNQLVKEHQDYDGYRAIHIKAVEVPCHQIIAYLKYGEKSIQKGMVTRHLNSIPMDNSWDNIGIGTPRDNSNDILPGVHSQSAIKRWNSRTFEQRSRINKKGALKITPAIHLKRAERMRETMTFEDRQKGHQTRKLLVDKVTAYHIIALRNNLSMNLLSKYYGIPVSQIRNIIYRQGKYTNL